MQSLIHTVLILAAINLYGQSEIYDLAVKNVTIIPCHIDSVWKRKTVLIKNERIAKIVGSEKINAKLIIDGKDKFLIPGLSDMHVHFPESDIHNFLALNRAAGVLFLRSMRGDLINTLQLRDSLTAHDPLTPRLILAAPPFYKNDSLTNVDSLVNAYKRMRYDLIKILSTDNEQRFYEIMNAAKKANINVAGHNPIKLVKTLESGFSSIEHLDGYYPYLKNDSLQYVIDKTISNNIYNCATIDWYSIIYLQFTKKQLHKRAGLDFASKRQVAAWDSLVSLNLANLNQLDSEKKEETKKRYKEIIDAKYFILKKLYDNGAKVLISPDATGNFQMPGYSLYEEMLHYRKAGVSNQLILRSATFTAAEYCKETALWGSVQTGRLANLVLLSKNPLDRIENILSIEGVIVNGNWVPQAELHNSIRK